MVDAQNMFAHEQITDRKNPCKLQAELRQANSTPPHSLMAAPALSVTTPSLAVRFLYNTLSSWPQISLISHALMAHTYAKDSRK